MIGAIVASVQITLCAGTSFDVPKGWTATLGNARVHRRFAPPPCAVDLWPPRWCAVNEASMWSWKWAPAQVFLGPAGTFDDIASAAGFYRDGERGWVYPSRGSEAKAVKFRIGKWSGLRGDGWSRGYARDDAPHDPEEAPVYSSDNRSVVLKRDGRTVAVHCDDGTPAYAVGCDVLIRTVFRSLR